MSSLIYFEIESPPGDNHGKGVDTLQSPCPIIMMDTRRAKKRRDETLVTFGRSRIFDPAIQLYR
jgi:hypothetical protein